MHHHRSPSQPHERLRSHGPGTMLSTLETAVSIFTLHGMPTFVREMIEDAAAKDGRPYEQFFLGALVEGVRSLGERKIAKAKATK